MTGKFNGIILSDYIFSNCHTRLFVDFGSLVHTISRLVSFHTVASSAKLSSSVSVSPLASNKQTNDRIDMVDHLRYHMKHS